MDHLEAVAAGMVERYVLGELDSPERDAFEEHFFSCEVCAVELRQAFEVRDAVRSVGGGKGVSPVLLQMPPKEADSSQEAAVSPSRKPSPSGINRHWGVWAAV